MNEIISARIKEAIENSGYSFAELQKITGISKSAMQRCAQGQTDKIPIEVISKVASATHYSPIYLSGWCDNPNYAIKSEVMHMSNKFEYQGKALKELRIRAGYTMQEVSSKQGKTKSWLSEIENGRKNVYFEDAKFMCKLYGVTLQDLSDLIDRYEK